MSFKLRWTFLLAAITVVMILIGLEVLVPRAPNGQSGDLVTAVTVSGPCFCTATVYVEGAKVDTAGCRWRVSGDTLFMLIRVEE